MKSMLYFSQYYPPEKGAASLRAFENINNLRRLGHNMTVICPFSNYPEGRISLKKFFKLYEKESDENLTIYRLPILAIGRSRSIHHYMLYFSFVFTSFIFCLFLKKRDLVYCSSPPLFITLSAFLISRIKRTELVLEIRDLWPESVKVVLKGINPFFIRIAERLEQFMYKKADRIIVVTKGFIDHISQYTKKEKIIYAPNGYDFTNSNTDLNIKTLDKSKLGLDNNKITIGYFGILGVSQSLLFTTQVAQSLPDDIQFLVLGFGAEYEKIETEIKKLNLKNYILIPAVEPDEVPSYISCADLFFVSLLDSPLFECALPSKMFLGMAHAKPLLCGISGEASSLVREAECGAVFKPQDVNDCKHVIKKLLDKKVNFKEMGLKGKNFVAEKFNRVKISKVISDAIENI